MSRFRHPATSEMSEEDRQYREELLDSRNGPIDPIDQPGLRPPGGEIVARSLDELIKEIEPSLVGEIVNLQITTIGGGYGNTYEATLTAEVTDNSGTQSKKGVGSGHSLESAISGLLRSFKVAPFKWERN